MFGGKKSRVARILERAVGTGSSKLPFNPVIGKQDSRLQSREDTWHQCVMVADDGYRVSAVLVDRSATGARVRFRSHEALPQRVTLIVAALGIQKDMDVAWQDRGDAGLRLLASN